jgi:hypothetical protein
MYEYVYVLCTDVCMYFGMTPESRNIEVRIDIHY